MPVRAIDSVAGDAPLLREGEVIPRGRRQPHPWYIDRNRMEKRYLRASPP